MKIAQESSDAIKNKFNIARSKHIFKDLNWNIEGLSIKEMWIANAIFLCESLEKKKRLSYFKKYI